MTRVDVEAFESRYAADADPWGFESTHYERRKYAVTVASLPRERYRRCFEPGCSIGVLTAQLATRCDEVVALDTSRSAVARARTRLAGVDAVDLRVGTLPEAWPSGSFDLMMLSEIGYYWDERGLDDIVARAWDALETGGNLVAVHWLGHSPDHLLHGRAVHRIIAARGGTAVVHHDDEEFVLDVWSRS